MRALCVIRIQDFTVVTMVERVEIELSATLSSTHQPPVNNNGINIIISRHAQMKGRFGWVYLLVRVGREKGKEKKRGWGGGGGGTTKL